MPLYILVWASFWPCTCVNLKAFELQGLPRHKACLKKYTSGDFENNSPFSHLKQDFSLNYSLILPPSSFSDLNDWLDLTYNIPYIGYYGVTPLETKLSLMMYPQTSFFMMLGCHNLKWISISTVHLWHLTCKTSNFAIVTKHWRGLQFCFYT